LYNKPFDQTNTAAGYVNGNPATNTAGSIPCAEGLEYPQREIVALIAAAQAMGLDAPSNADLKQMLKAVRSGLLGRFSATGTADAIAIAPDPAYVGLVEGLRFRFKVPGTAGAANASTAPKFTVSGLAAATILRRDGAALAAGDLVSGRVVEVEIDAGLNARLAGLVASEFPAGSSGPSQSTVVSWVLPYTVAGAVPSKVFSPGQFQSDISTVGSYVVVQTLFMSNISYMDARASVAFRNDTASVVNVTAQLQLYDATAGAYVGTGQYLGEVIYNSFQVPITVNGQFQGLNKARTYRLELAVQKQQAIQTAVLDGSIIALHD
jgi:hypothetical protein